MKQQHICLFVLNAKCIFCRVSLCLQSGLHPIPALWFCVDDLSNVLILLNSSLNFYIYCVVGKKFRTELSSFLREKCSAEDTTVTDVRI